VIFWLMSHGLTVGDSALAMPFNVVLVLGIVLPLSALTYYAVERPAMKWKKRPTRIPDSPHQEPLSSSALS
jgi:peptidoglycan/LPS O-acetylase OafA/YrhL